MANPQPDSLFDAFIADGNRIIGDRPKVISGSFAMSWQGSGSVMEFGENVTLKAAKIGICGAGGNISIGSNVTVRGSLLVRKGGAIRIGDGTVMNRPSDIRAGEGASVQIGRGCLFSNVKIMTSDMHSILDVSTGHRTNPAAGIAIEDEVWLAEDVKVAKGVRIGSGSIVAAGSLVTRSIAPFCLAAGRPAKVVRCGVSWKRALTSLQPLPAPAFKPEEIPIEKNALQLFMSRGEYSLVEAACAASVAKAGGEDIPIFVLWYLVASRHKLGKLDASSVETLDHILKCCPNHEAARRLRAKFH